MKTIIIAEAGVNHNGRMDLARELVKVSAEACADFVKFQSFVTEALLTKTAEKADYQKVTTGDKENQFEMLKRLELSQHQQRELQQHAKACGIGFISSPFDLISARFLIEELQVPFVKVPSGELTNSPLLLMLAQKKIPVVVSTGMASMGEIESALGVLAYGYSADSMQTKSRPSLTDFRRAYCSVGGQEQLQSKVTLLHCTTQYPAPYSEIHLRAMETLRRSFGLNVGYSDHTEGIEVALAAVALGASVIEKHFTLDRSLPGPDHSSSLTPVELKALVAGVRKVEMALGRAQKLPVPAELGNTSVARKSLVAAHNIKRGEPFTVENLTVKRPGTGKAPILYWETLAQKADRDYEKDELI